MKRVLLFSISIFSIVILLTSSLLFPIACNRSTQSVYWQNLQKDKQWIQNVNQYLNLSYVEDKDQAAFIRISEKDLNPTFYSTYYVFKMLKAVGTEIENQNQIIDYLNSTRNQYGTYLDPQQNHHLRPATETRQALTVITGLGAQPENIDMTIQYLLSLECSDGTFLEGTDEQVSGLEDTRIARIYKGTYSVVDSLIMSGNKNKIPQSTKDMLVSEVVSSLDERESFPSLSDNNTWSLITAIELLTKIDPSIVPDRAREFIAYALKEVINIPADAYYFTSGVNILLNIAQPLHLPEANQESILKGISVYLKEKIFPLQNSSGGFGPSETIEPLSTSEVVILAKRLAVEYPNLEKLLSNVNAHFVDTGWTTFFIYRFDNTNYQSTYYGIEIAKFSGYDNYNKKKVEQFLTGCFTSGATSLDAGNLQDVYYAVMALKAMNGKLKQEEGKNAEALCLQLAEKLLTVSETEVNIEFTFAVQISKEVGFDLPENINTVIPQLIGYYRDNNILRGQSALIPFYLQLLWESMDQDNPTITRDEVIGYLDILYDKDSGAYTVPSVSGVPTNPDQQVTYTPHPDIFQTYSALKLLSDIRISLPEKDKTVKFVMSSKQKFGFSRAPDRPNLNLEATFAALMILKQLSQ